MEKEILKLLENDSKLTPEKIAVMLNTDVENVEKTINRLEDNRTILKYKTLINWEKTDSEYVMAIIDLKVTPQRGEGFDKIAERIYQYPEVKSVYLMSGSYDLGVIMEGYNMKEIALFVAEKLGTMDHVLSTATHFVLRKYKESGVIFDDDQKDERRMITL